MLAKTHTYIFRLAKSWHWHHRAAFARDWTVNVAVRERKRKREEDRVEPSQNGKDKSLQGY